jgi:hypothetical protein
MVAKYLKKMVLQAESGLNIGFASDLIDKGVTIRG